MWSSLPMLLLWMIRDKLDIFDNLRLGAVCRDWRAASLLYPRTLTSVGDGVPWIWNFLKREFISFPGKNKFQIDRPEFSNARLISSKQGWLLLKRSNGGPLLVLVNVFTGATIKLPELPTKEEYYGSFTIFNGVPHRVFLFIQGHTAKVTVKTALAGDDEAWTCSTYQLTRKPFGMSNIIGIGHSLYFQDTRSKVVVFNVGNESSKELPPPGSSGFIAEHDGGLIYIERKVLEPSDAEEGGDDSKCINYDYSSFVMYQYNEDAPTLWEGLDKTAVMGTSWFLSEGHDCIAAKGNGLKVYDIRQMEWWKDHLSRTFVVVYDLVAGTTEVHRLPVAVMYPLRWVGIG